ncbi:hypothetical protein TAMC210_18120 [Thermanaeromonas sp. C210]|nr:hypothetical protein [Thermanaeromonas sp. C210]GFN23495.1 hypothetical protein TAMC210_18120 [Thermanaeromonas sp. C210]
MGAALQTPSMPQKWGRNDEQRNEKQELAGQAKNSCLYRLADGLEILGTHHLKTDYKTHCEEHGHGMGGHAGEGRVAKS